MLRLAACSENFKRANWAYRRWLGTSRASVHKERVKSMRRYPNEARPGCGGRRGALAGSTAPQSAEVSSIEKFSGTIGQGFGKLVGA